MGKRDRQARLKAQLIVVPSLNGLELLENSVQDVLDLRLCKLLPDADAGATAEGHPVPAVVRWLVHESRQCSGWRRFLPRAKATVLPPLWPEFVSVGSVDI